MERRINENNCICPNGHATKFFFLKGVFSLFFIIMMLSKVGFAQDFEAFSVPVVQNGEDFINPFAGGMNTPQFSKVDLNNDNIEDLYVFDRIGNVHLTFLHNGETGNSDYFFDPKYAKNFPVIDGWALLRDYNQDGIQDLFAFSNVPGVPGIIAFKGYYEADELKFEQVAFPQNPFDIVYFDPPGGGDRIQLYITRIDYPAVDDLDCDGDLDILTFNAAGGYVEFYANQSVEQGFGMDTLIYELQDNCWGGFYESGVSVEVDLAQNQNACFENLQDVEPRHAGSTLMTLDINNDGAKELVLGDLSFTNLNLLSNAGDCGDAWMNTQDPVFPNYDTPVEIDFFPASFYLDIDNDGFKDMLASPNAGNNTVDYEVGWLYKNVGSFNEVEFQLLKKDFLVETMLDFGSGARPVFVDYNQDGLTDILIGNTNLYQPFGALNSRLYLLENVGSATEPSFDLVTDDYLELSSFSQTLNNFAPSFGDLDADGDLDILIGDGSGQLLFAENIAGPNSTFEFGPWEYPWSGIDVGQVAVPQIIDVDEDGLLDLLIGERTGNVNFFKNIGSAERPEFISDQEMAPNTFFYGQVDARIPGYATGYSSPKLVRNGELSFFLLGTEIDGIRRYGVGTQVLDPFPLIEEIYGGINAGEIVHFDLTDLNDDGVLDMVVGNRRGGISLFRTDLEDMLVSTENNNVLEGSIQLWPNPTQGWLNLNWNGDEVIDAQVQIFHIDGRLLKQMNWNGSFQQLSMAEFSPGMYVAKVQLKQQVWSKRIIKLD